MTNEDKTLHHTEQDPFSVDPNRSIGLSLPLMFLFLPCTLLAAIGLAISSILIIPFYKNRSLEARDKLSSILVWFLLATARFKLNVTDHNNHLDDHSQLYVAPHICMLEAIMLIGVVGHVRPMTAEFTKDLPLFGRFVKASDPIYVKRGKGKQKQSVVELLKESIETTAYRHLVFPEGTFTNGKTLIQFKSGSFVVGKPITPVVFKYPTYTPFWNREESSFPIQIFRLISRLYTPVIIDILPTYHPSPEELEDPKLYAENVRKLIAHHSGLPLSSLGLQDSPNYRQDRKT